MTDTTGRIVDLSEEKVYELDLKKKTYTVTTFDELRRQLREAREKAQREAPKEGKSAEQEPEQERKTAKEIEVDFDVKETGQKKSIAGYDAREVVDDHHGPRKGQDARGGRRHGGDLRHVARAGDSGAEGAGRVRAALLEGDRARGGRRCRPSRWRRSWRCTRWSSRAIGSAEDARRTKLEGTPLATTTTFEAVKSKEQAGAGEQRARPAAAGLGGMLARKMMKKDADKPRATIFTVHRRDAGNRDDAWRRPTCELPAGFKRKEVATA